MLSVPHMEKDLCRILDYERKAVTFSENASW